MTTTLESTADIPLQDDPAEGLRPTALLPWRQLALIAAYWFGISAIWEATRRSARSRSGSSWATT